MELGGSNVDHVTAAAGHPIIHTACPACGKTHGVDLATVNDDLAFLTCPACGTEFFFALDQVRDGRVHSLKLDLPLQRLPLSFVERSPIATSDPLAQVSKENKSGQSPMGRVSVPAKNAGKNPAPLAERACPRCHATGDANRESCDVCGVVFAKYEILQRDPELRRNSSAELVRRWRDVLADYSHQKKHQDFEVACRRKDQLTYCLKCYERVLAVLPDDDLAASTVRRLREELERGGTASDSSPWSVQVTVLLAAASLMIVWGLFSSTSRNLVGVGTSILAVWFGIRFWQQRPR